MSSSESDSERPSEPPIHPEALLDLVQALGGLTSESEGQRDFALKLHKAYFEELPTRFERDERASSYLREVLTAVASAVRGFAVERTAFRSVRSAEQKLEELRSRVTSAKFFHAPVDSESGAKAYAIVVKLVGGTAGASAVVKGWSALSWWGVLAISAATLAWVLLGDLLFALLTVRLQLAAYRRTGDTDGDIRKAFHRSVTSYKELSLLLLVTAERSRDRLYPRSRRLLGDICWSAVADHELDAFLRAPNAALGKRSPAEVLSRIVDLHFGVRSVAPFYLAQAETSASNATNARTPAPPA